MLGPLLTTAARKQTWLGTSRIPLVVCRQGWSPEPWRKRIVRVRSIAQTVSTRRCISGRAMELVKGMRVLLGVQ